MANIYTLHANKTVFIIAKRLGGQMVTLLMNMTDIGSNPSEKSVLLNKLCINICF